MRAGRDLERLEHIALGRLPHLLGDERLQVERGDLLLLVGNLLEARERLVERIAFDLEAELGERIVQRVPPGVLSEHDRVRLQADLARVHDLVGGALLEHPVLVDAGLVGEGVAADHGLVRLHRIAGEARDHAAGPRQLAGVDPCVQPVDVATGPKQHHDLLQRAVPGALADPVHGALHLAGAGQHARRRSWQPPSPGRRGNGRRGARRAARAPARRGARSSGGTPRASCSRRCPGC